MRTLGTHVILATLLLFPRPVGAQTPHDGVARTLGLSPERDSGVEVRVWLRGTTGVASLYRLVKTGDEVSVDRFAWAEVVHPAKGGATNKQAKRETQSNRRLIEKAGCTGKVVVGSDYFWCKVDIRTDGAWSAVFDDLRPDELWKLPARIDAPCVGDGAIGVLLRGDDAAVRIDILERGRRHSVEYWNPESCLRNGAFAIADHVRTVVRNIH